MQTTKITRNPDRETKRVWGRVPVFQLQFLSDRPTNMAAAVAKNVYFLKKEIKRLVMKKISQDKT